MKSQNTIEVNGRRYDASSGALLGSASVPPVRTGGNMDGFFRARSSAPKNATVAATQPEKVAVRITPQPKAAVHRVAPAPQPAVMHVAKEPAESLVAVKIAPKPKLKPHAERTINHARAHAPQLPAAKEPRMAAVAQPSKQKLADLHSPANHAKPRATQNSLTLMRSAVKRPTPSLVKQLGPKGALQHSVPSLIVPKASVNSVDSSRLERAKSVERSPHVVHHGVVSRPAIHPTLAPLAVQPVPVKPEGEVPGTAPAPQPTNKPDDPGKTPDMFEQAMANASHFVDVHAHRAHFNKQARKHVTSMAAGTLALLVIAGFAAYQNTPGLQFKVASIQAGVTTGMPNFKAAGFAYNGVRAHNGELTVGFNNTKGSYQLTQTNTNLSGNDMIQNIGATDASGTPNYRTIQAGDTTVYRFDNTGATWVSGGKWYTVSGSSALTDSQVESLIRNI